MARRKNNRRRRAEREKKESPGNYILDDATRKQLGFPTITDEESFVTETFPTGAPAFEPSIECMLDFNGYVNELVKYGAFKYGAVRIKPPQGWMARSSSWDEAKLEKFRAFVQAARLLEYKPGFFEHIRESNKGPMTYKHFLKSYPKYSPPGSMQHWDEETFWKTAHTKKLRGLYGADIPQQSLMEEVAGSWHLGRLRETTGLSILGEDFEIGGITSPYIYHGAPGTYFAWHREDVDLFSVNYNHHGEPKTWYAFPAIHAARFEDYVRSIASTALAENCQAPMTHKSILVDPRVIVAETGIRITKLVQQAGEFIITFPAAYHAGFNNGLNCAEATNFLNEFWLKYGLTAPRCTCGKDVAFPLQPFVQKWMPHLVDRWFRGDLIVELPGDSPLKERRRQAIPGTIIDHDSNYDKVVEKQKHRANGDDAPSVLARLLREQEKEERTAEAAIKTVGSAPQPAVDECAENDGPTYEQLCRLQAKTALMEKRQRILSRQLQQREQQLPIDKGPSNKTLKRSYHRHLKRLLSKAKPINPRPGKMTIRAEDTFSSEIGYKERIAGQTRE